MGTNYYPPIFFFHPGTRISPGRPDNLSLLSFFNCVKIGVLAATYHFVEFADGDFYIVVSDKQAKKSIETLNLNNITVICNDNEFVLENIA